MQQARSISTGALGKFFNEISEGFRRQSNVVFALIFKDFMANVTGRYALSLLWVIVEPATQSLALCAFWYLMRRQQIDGINVVLFVTVSMLVYSIFQRSISGIPRALKSNEAFYNYQQVKPIDSIIARFILEWLLLMTGAAITLFLLGWYLDLYISTSQLPQLLGMLLLATAFGFGTSLVLATYSALYPFVGNVTKMLTRALIYVSGVFYAVSDLPTPARVFISWNPIAQIIEYARHYAFGTKLFPEADLDYAMLSALFMVFLGLTGYFANRFRLMEKK